MKGLMFSRLRGLGDGGALFLFLGVMAGGDDVGGYASGEDSRAIGSADGDEGRRSVPAMDFDLSLNFFNGVSNRGNR